MNYVEHLNLFGVEAKEIPCIKFEGPPTESTVGAVGLLGMDTLTGDVWKCVAVDGGKYTWARLVTEEKFDPAVYGLPVLKLTGDTSAMTKENAVDLSYVYGDRSGIASVKWQGSSSLAYPKKNYTIKFDNAFEAAPGWGEQKKYCLKANYIDHSHARNVVSAKLWGQIVNSRDNPIINPQNLQNIFDITKCGGMCDYLGNIVSGTQPISGVMSTNRTLAVHGVCVLDGLVCAKGIYTIKADVFVASSDSTAKVCLGYNVLNTDNPYHLTKMVSTNVWTNVEITMYNPFEISNVLIMLESIAVGGKIDIKNINISQERGESVFDFSSIDGFVGPNGEDLSYYNSVDANGLVISANLTAYYNNAFITGKTYPKGKYKIYFSAFTPRTETEIPHKVRVGFGSGHNIVSTYVEIEQEYLRSYFEVELENTIDNAYFTLQPMGGADSSVNESAKFNFSHIGINNISAVIDVPNGGAIDGFPVVITLNGDFHGLYTFNIPKDGWMFGMGFMDTEAILCADYSEACWFRAEATLTNDFDLEYVSDENNSAWVTDSVNRLINECINSDGSNLDTTIAQYLDWESAIDYVIFKALLNGVDMAGKNYILATYDGIKWYFSAYDMDCVYGLDWDGKKFYNVNIGDPMGRGHTVDRLILDYKKDALKNRYAELRAGVMSVDNVVTTFTNFIGGISKILYEEDVRKWPSIPNTATNNIAQIADYYKKRAEFVDAFVEAL